MKNIYIDKRNKERSKKGDSHFDEERGMIVLSEDVKETFRECQKYLQNKNRKK